MAGRGGAGEEAVVVAAGAVADEWISQVRGGCVAVDGCVWVVVNFVFVT